MKIPMLQKYVDEAVGVFFILGIDGTGGGVYINDGQKDVFTSLPLDVAYKVVIAHEEFREKLYKILCDKGEASEKRT